MADADDQVDTLRNCLNLLGWTQRQLSIEIGYTEKQISRWMCQKAPIPVIVFRYLELKLKAEGK